MVGHHPFIVNSTHRWQSSKTLYIRKFIIRLTANIFSHYLVRYLHFAVMDYMRGGELFSLVEEYGCLPEEVVRIYVAEVALAIGKNLRNVLQISSING